MVSPLDDRRYARVAGATLIATCLGFVLAFQLLGSAMGYPDMLDLPASQVLPRLLAGGPRLRAIWLFYAALPAGLTVAALACFPLLQRGHRLYALGALLSAVVSTAAMSVGLLRWPTLQWTLAQAFAHAGADERRILSALFDAANLYLGNAIGELCGELLMACFFVLSGCALRKVQGVPRWLWAGALLSGLLFAVGALRVISDAVQPLADFNNIWLPVWLLAHGVGLLRLGSER